MRLRAAQHAGLTDCAIVQVMLSVALVGRNVAETTVMASTMVLLNMFAPKSSIGSINGAAQTLMNLGEPNYLPHLSPAGTIDADSLSLYRLSIDLAECKTYEGQHCGTKANISFP